MSENSYPQPIEVFFSYAREDEEFRIEIVKHLSLLERQGVITGWHDRKISGGSEYKDAIDAHLESAHIILLLISSDFLASDYCYEIEVDHAMQRHAAGKARVIPVILRNCDWSSATFGKLQPLPKNARPIRNWDDADEAYKDVAEGIRKAISEILQEGQVFDHNTTSAFIPESRIPYRSLQPFTENDASFFFGREEETKALVDKLRSNTFIAIIGASGSGKSSLVRGGLIPVLRRGAILNSGTWKLIVFAPGATPIESLAVGLSELGLEKSMGKVIDEIKEDSREFHLHTLLALSKRPPEERVIWVVDQFEEIFTLCTNEHERKSFIESLLICSSYPGSRNIVIITMRTDFFKNCEEYTELAKAIFDNQFPAKAMNENSLRRIIEEPAKQVGLSVEPQLITEILEDIAKQPGSLALLEHALFEVWRRRSNGELTLTAYRQSGGVKEALAKRASEIYNSLPPPAQVVAQRIMLRLTQPGDVHPDTRRRSSIDELITRPDEANLVITVINQFANERLLTTNGDPITQHQFVDVSHEALIRNWPLLKTWIDKDRAGLKILLQLNEAAREWRSENFNEDFLYHGRRIGTALKWQSKNEEKLNNLEREFLLASNKLRQRKSRNQRFLAIISFVLILSMLHLGYQYLKYYYDTQQKLADNAINEIRQALLREDFAKGQNLIKEYQSKINQIYDDYQWKYLWDIYHRACRRIRVPKIDLAPLS